LLLGRSTRKGSATKNTYGTGSFANELHHSFHEFVAIIVSRLGYLPSRAHLMEEE